MTREQAKRATENGFADQIYYAFTDGLTEKELRVIFDRVVKDNKHWEKKRGKRTK